VQSWRILKLCGDPAADEIAVRLNSLGSLFFFLHYTLKRDKLSTIHKLVCKSLERERLRLVLELPRNHYKTTIVAEGLPIWWALPFTENDEYLMRRMGYGDSWVNWMHYAHDADTSTLLIAETEKNTVLNGTLVDHHYQNNERFRHIFPEIIPDGTTTWNTEIKIHRRSAHGQVRKEGTYHYRGVGQAVTGLHPARAIEDDLFGLEAQQSEAVAEATIRYHRMLGGVIGNGDNVVDGNRWSVADLDGWIRENDKTFVVESHSAEGGCCELHPSGEALFPEEWPMERLLYQRARMGDYDYSHQYLNVPLLQSDIVFRAEWLRYYRFKQSNPNKPLDDPTNFLLVEHEVYNGKAREDIDCGVLDLRIIVDPNHAGKRGRCAHAISVIGYDQETQRFYLLDEWSKSCGYRDFCEEIYATAYKWGLFDVWIETVAAQVYLKLYLEELNLRKSKRLRFHDLPLDNRAAAKDRRIESLEPYIRNEQFWMHQSHSIARKQLLGYYRGKDMDVDLIDTLGYAPQLYNLIRKREVLKNMRERQEEFEKVTADSQTGY
jgi:hypothetical protein